jgi:hypothetical protein
MDSAKLILTQPVLPPAPLEHLGAALFCKPAAKLDPDKISGFSEEEKRQIADNGGFGLWKDIYQFLNNSNRANATTESLDESV